MCCGDKSLLLLGILVLSRTHVKLYSLEVEVQNICEDLGMKKNRVAYKSVEEAQKKLAKLYQFKIAYTSLILMVEDMT